jgi:predicted secreted protein
MTTPATTRLTGDLAQTSVGITGSQLQTLGLTEWEINRKAKNVDSTTTDDAGDETNINSSRSWDATAKFAYIDSDTTQATNILNSISSAQTAVQWNFFPDAVTGRGAWSGKAWVTGYKLTGGVGKLFAMDVTLKGTGPLTFGVQLAPTGNQAEC